MNKKVLIMTGTTDTLRSDQETDNTMEEVFDLTLPSKQRYTKKYGYDLLALRSFGVHKEGIFQAKHLGFLRALRSFEMLQYYDIVMWIDADTLITNDTYKIEDFIDDTSLLSISWDWNGKSSFSTGNFVLQNKDNTSDFFHMFNLIGKAVIENNQWGEEQATFNLIYQNTTFKNNIKILEHKFLNSIPSKQMFRGIWDGRPDPFAPWTPESFLVHITGVPNKNRIDVLKNSFGQYL
jgi:hypothetical protein